MLNKIPIPENRFLWPFLIWKISLWGLQNVRYSRKSGISESGTMLAGFNKFGFNESSRFNESVLTSKVKK